MRRRPEVTVLPGAMRAWRKERGEMSQATLAKQAGCSLTMIALIETGERQPSLDTLEAIAYALDVQPEALALVTPKVVDVSAEPVAPAAVA